MIKDGRGRTISYLRVSVTDKCNLRCKYCMPEDGVKPKKHEDMLTLEEMTEVIKYCSEYGIDKVRITGGEPLVKKGILSFIENIKKINKVKKINLTTNGLLLKEMAVPLRKAGINDINISLDTLNEEKYRDITRCGDLNKVLEGIDASLKAGFDTVKINTVLLKGFNDNEIDDIVNLAADSPIIIRFIELMGVGEAKKFKANYLSTDILLEKIKELKRINLVGGGPATYYSKKGFKGHIGLINPISSCFCQTCNRIRFTADGNFIPCLHSDIKINVYDIVRNKNIEALRKTMKRVISLKPEGHKLAEHYSAEQNRFMSQIGG